MMRETNCARVKDSTGLTGRLGQLGVRIGVYMFKTRLRLLVITALVLSLPMVAHFWKAHAGGGGKVVGGTVTLTAPFYFTNPCNSATITNQPATAVLSVHWLRG